MKYGKRNKEFVKFTIRIEVDELEKFKSICNIFGLSGNNQITILIREFIFKNRNLIEENTTTNQNTP